MPIQQQPSSQERMGPVQGAAISPGQRELLETQKIQLTRRQDFNLIDAFSLFDVDGNGKITVDEIYDGITQILDQRSTTRQDVVNFMRVFNKNQDGQLKHSEFCDAFLPIDAMLASKLAHTPPQVKTKEVNFNDANQVYRYRRGLFCVETRKEFGNLWRTHFNICGSLM